MATIDTILEGLSKIEKKNYRAVIDVALSQFAGREIELQVLQGFFNSRFRREDALYDAIDSKYKSSIADSYGMFRSILVDISGKNEDLDDRNGVLNQNVYGKIGKQRERRRVIAELSKRGSAVSLDVINKFSTYKAKLIDLKNRLT